MRKADEIARGVNDGTRAATAAGYSPPAPPRERSRYNDGSGAAMIPNWAIWAGGMVLVVVNLLAWTLVRINDLPPSRR
jgi:hypothetical protein